MHPSIFSPEDVAEEKLVPCNDAGCESCSDRPSWQSIHCPVCPPQSFQPTYRSKVVSHIESHLRTAIHLAGVYVMRCRSACERYKAPHYHCPCCRVIRGKVNYIVQHVLSKHPDGTVPPSSGRRIGSFVPDVDLEPGQPVPVASESDMLISYEEGPGAAAQTLGSFSEELAQEAETSIETVAVVGSSHSGSKASVVRYVEADYELRSIAPTEAVAKNDEVGQSSKWATQPIAQLAEQVLVLEQVEDKPVFRAYNTLPDHILQFAQHSIDGQQQAKVVVAKQPINAGVLFGPLTAPEATWDAESPDLDKYLPVFGEQGIVKCLSTDDPVMCSWMMLIRRAVNTEEQNLGLVQEDGRLYYLSTRLMAVGEELRYHYGGSYLQDLQHCLPTAHVPALMGPSVTPVFQTASHSDQEISCDPMSAKDDDEEEEDMEEDAGDMGDDDTEDSAASLSDSEVVLATNTRSHSLRTAGRANPASQVLMATNKKAAAKERQLKKLKGKKPKKEPKNPRIEQRELKLKLLEHNSKREQDPKKLAAIRKSEDKLQQEIREIQKDSELLPKYPHKLIVVYPPKLDADNELEYTTKGIRYAINQLNSMKCTEMKVTFSEPLPVDVDHTTILMGINAVQDVNRRRRPLYMCSQCKYTHFVPVETKRHTLLHTDYKFHACDICSQTFHWRCSLTKHKKCHTERERTFLCKYCGKGFYDSERLKRHEKIHTGEDRTFACTHCGKVFHYPNHLRRHVKEVHLKIKAHQCHLCGKRFGQKPGLQKHVSSQHGKPLP